MSNCLYTLVVPNPLFLMDWFNVRQYFQRQAFKVWRINTKYYYDVTCAGKPVVFSMQPMSQTKSFSWKHERKSK